MFLHSRKCYVSERRKWRWENSIDSIFHGNFELCRNVQKSLKVQIKLNEKENSCNFNQDLELNFGSKKSIFSAASMFFMVSPV
jgi:hypothetical protein